MWILSCWRTTESKPRKMKKKHKLENWKKTMEPGGDVDTNANWCTHNDHQRLGKEAGTRDHPNYSILKIGFNTEKSPVKDHQLTLAWKTCNHSIYLRLFISSGMSSRGVVANVLDCDILVDVSIYLSIYLSIYPFISLYRNPRSVVAELLDCSLKVREFKLQLRYYVHFQTDTLGKGTFLSSSNRLNSFGIN